MLWPKWTLLAVAGLTLLSSFDVVAQQVSSRDLPQASPAPMTNADVIALVTAEIPDDLILAKIHAAGKQTSFDTSIAGIKALRQSGVSTHVIRYMIDPSIRPGSASIFTPLSRGPVSLMRLPDGRLDKTTVDDPDDPAQPHAPGIYLRAKGRDGQMHMTKLDHINTKNTKTSGTWLSGITYGAAQTHTRAAVDGAHATVQTNDTDPLFYAYIPEDNIRFGGNNLSVRDLTLIRFEARGNTRETKIGSYSAWGSSSGPDPNAKQGFSVEQIRIGVYKLMLDRPLEAGEYAFEHQNFGAFYDFTINKGK